MRTFQLSCSRMYCRYTPSSYAAVFSSTSVMNWSRRSCLFTSTIEDNFSFFHSIVSVLGGCMFHSRQTSDDPVKRERRISDDNDCQVTPLETVSVQDGRVGVRTDSSTPPRSQVIRFVLILSSPHAFMRHRTSLVFFFVHITDNLLTIVKVRPARIQREICTNL